MGELIALRRKSLMAILCMNECQREEIRGDESNLNGLHHMLDVPGQHPVPEHEVYPYANHQDISDINCDNHGDRRMYLSFSGTCAKWRSKASFRGS